MSIESAILGPYAPCKVRARMRAWRADITFYSVVGPAIGTYGQCLKGRRDADARLSPDHGKRKHKVAGYARRADSKAKDRRKRADAHTTRCKRYTGAAARLAACGIL